MPRKPKLAPHLRIRLDADLLARVEKSRQANHRTLTGEIAHRLLESFKREELREVIEETVTVTISKIKLTGGTVTTTTTPKESEKK